MFCFCDFSQNTKKVLVDKPIQHHPAQDDHEQTEVIRELRDLPPTHYLFKIQNFSHLSDGKIPNFESSDFEIGGYKWKLKSCIYPQGNKKLVNEKAHISLYLVLSESNSLPLERGVNVYFKLFVYNQIEDKYLTVQDAMGRVVRFRGNKTERGFEKLLPLDVFKDESNGYLVNDKCVFGAEVFVLDPSNKNADCANVMKELGENNTYTWNIQNFETLTEEPYESGIFSIGGYNWSLWIYPNGVSSQKGINFSAFLYLEDSKALNLIDKLKVKYTLRVRDQLNGNHHEKWVSFHFSGSAKNFGFPGFMPLTKLNDASKGYIINGLVIVELQISSIGIIY